MASFTITPALALQNLGAAHRDYLSDDTTRTPQI